MCLRQYTKLFLIFCLLSCISGLTRANFSLMGRKNEKRKAKRANERLKRACVQAHDAIQSVRVEAECPEVEPVPKPANNRRILPQSAHPEPSELTVIWQNNEIRVFSSRKKPNTSHWDPNMNPNRSSLITFERRESRREELRRSIIDRESTNNLRTDIDKIVQHISAVEIVEEQS